MEFGQWAGRVDALMAMPPVERAEAFDQAVRDLQAMEVGMELDLAAAELLIELSTADPYRRAICALLVGCTLEFGSSARSASAPLRGAAVDAMEEAARFAETWSQGEPEGPMPESPILDAAYLPPSTQIPNRSGSDWMVEGEDLQRWAARDPVGAKAWSCLDLLFRPLMALARSNEEALDDVRNDEALGRAVGRLATADPLMFLPFMGHSESGQFVMGLLQTGGLPAFSDEVEREAPDGTRQPQIRAEIKLEGIDELDGVIMTTDQVDVAPVADPPDDGVSTAPLLNRIAYGMRALSGRESAELTATTGDGVDVDFEMSDPAKATLLELLTEYVRRSRALGQAIEELHLVVPAEGAWLVSTKYREVSAEAGRGPGEGPEGVGGNGVG